MQIPASVVILTQDEEKNLSACLQSIEWCDDIIIVDSGSRDGTVDLARTRGLQCIHHPFESFAKQRNWALDSCNFNYKWVFFLDADERSTTEFDNAFSQALNKADESVAGFYCCSKMILDGCWLKRSGSFPHWQFRVVRLGQGRFIDYGHGQKEHNIKGRLEYIREPYLHYPFNKGWKEWWIRHNRYAKEEAIARLNDRINWKEIFSEDGSIRNKALRPLVSRIPGWPFIRFCLDYFVRLGFLEGLPGLVYCFHMALCELKIQFQMCKLSISAFKIPNRMSM